MSYGVTLGCGCEVYVACHPETGAAHARIIERRAETCGVRAHETGARLRAWELAPSDMSWRRGYGLLPDGGFPRYPFCPARPASENATAPETFSSVLARVRAEFVEMPGLTLSVSQASRLWALDSEVCAAVIATLVETRFLVRTRDARFARAS